MTADRLKMACAAALDLVRDNLPINAAAELTIVVPHTGTCEDAFVIGTHSLDDLIDIVVHLQRVPIEEGDVTATSYDNEGITIPRRVQ